MKLNLGFSFLTDIYGTGGGVRSDVGFSGGGEHVIHLPNQLIHLLNLTKISLLRIDSNLPHLSNIRLKWPLLAQEDLPVDARGVGQDQPAGVQMALGLARDGLDGVLVLHLIGPTNA